MEIFALVGRSGTGKSYKALYLAHEKEIEYIIDDGLFIKGNKIIAGKSAKRQDTIIGAIKTALFQETDHRNQVKSSIRKIGPEKILVIGTSKKMVDKIVKALDIGEIKDYVFIEDISTKEEMEIARKHRNELGKHVIPVPTFELKSDFSGYFLDPLKIFRKRKGGGSKIKDEKSVVRPTYSYMGKYMISDRVIRDIVEYATYKVPGVHRILKIDVDNHANGIVIRMDISATYGKPLNKLAKGLQGKINQEVEYMTSINILETNINVKELVTP